MDKEDRVIFKWRNEVNEQRERASDMRRRNEALVYNILPVHVAEHFLRNKQRSYDQLYSQSYDEVGVLFASMPNFSGNFFVLNLLKDMLNLQFAFTFLLADFYSEDTVNNQGLECLRFLNEVISDFDAVSVRIFTVCEFNQTNFQHFSFSSCQNIRMSTKSKQLAQHTWLLVV